MASNVVIGLHAAPDVEQLGHPPLLEMETAGERRAQDAPAVRH